MKAAQLALLVLGLACGCADRPLSAVAGPPRPDAGAAHDLALTPVGGHDGGARDGGSLPVADLAVAPPPSDLGAIGAPAPPWSGEAVAYQIDPMHRGAQAGTLKPPLHKLWTTTTIGPVSYPLIANGRVFYIVATGGSNYLYALDAPSGKVEWGMTRIGSNGTSSLAWDGGRVFTVNADGTMMAFLDSSGAKSWTAQVGLSPSPPTASNGLVYVTGGDTVQALDEVTGNTRWSEDVLAGGGSSPIVSAAAVFLPFICGQAWAFTPLGGDVIWHANPNCDGGGSLTGALDDGRLYLRSPGSSDLILNAASGSKLGVFMSDRIPAFDDQHLGYYVSHASAGNGILVQQDESGNVDWSFRGDGNLITAPIIVNRYAYVGSTSGTLFAVDIDTATQVWSDDTGAPFADPDQLADLQPLSGLAAAENLVIVANTQQLVAYGQ